MLFRKIKIPGFAGCGSFRYQPSPTRSSRGWSGSPIRYYTFILMRLNLKARPILSLWKICFNWKTCLTFRNIHINSGCWRSRVLTTKRASSARGPPCRSTSPSWRLTASSASRKNVWQWHSHPCPQTDERRQSTSTSPALSSTTSSTPPPIQVNGGHSLMTSEL